MLKKDKDIINGEENEQKKTKTSKRKNSNFCTINFIINTSGNDN